MEKLMSTMPIVDSDDENLPKQKPYTQNCSASKDIHLNITLPEEQPLTNRSINNPAKTERTYLEATSRPNRLKESLITEVRGKINEFNSMELKKFQSFEVNEVEESANKKQPVKQVETAKSQTFCYTERAQHQSQMKIPTDFQQNQAGQSRSKNVVCSSLDLPQIEG